MAGAPRSPCGLRRRPRPCSGQTNVELGAILVFVSIVTVVLLTQLGPQVQALFSGIAAF